MSATKPKIYVVGSFVMGLTIQVPRMPSEGETLLGHNFDFGPGGKGINQAIAAARAGGEVKTIVALGDDFLGDRAIKTLKVEGLYSASVKRIKNTNTGCGFVTLLDSGENTIVIDPGANLHLTAAMIKEDEAAIKDAKVVMAQLEVSDEAVEEALQLAKKHGAITILNPAPARTIPLSILRYVDVLTPNETEAKILLGLPLDRKTSTKELGLGLLQLGVKNVIITLGKKGAFLINESGTEHFKAIAIQVIDPTGAGDCFNGNLAYGLSLNLNIKKAIERAICAGSYCAQHLGVINGLPNKKKLDEFIKNIKV